MATVLADEAPPAARPRVRRSPLWWPVVAVPAAAAVVYTVLTRRLTGDLQYVLGALRLGGEAGYSPSEVFTHRPFFYRWFVALLDVPTFGGTIARETLIEAEGALIAAAAAFALYTALLRRVSGREAALTAGATGLLLVLAPRTDFLQPEWTAVVLTVLGIAAALGPARPWPAALLAALPLGLAVMMKYSTASTAAVGVLLVWAVDRGRAVRVALVAVPGAIALFGLSVLAGSHEWQWTEDMPQINKSALSRTGIDPSFILERSVDFLADRAVLSPVLLLLPGALLLILARVQGRLRRLELLLIALLIGVGALAVVVVQGNWFLYHAVQLTVVAAAMWGLAVGGARRSPPWCFGVVSLLFGALPVLYAEAPKGLQRPATVWALGLVALLAAVVDARVEARRRAAAKPGSRGVWPAALVALAGVVCLSGSIWPGSPHLVSHGKVGLTSATFLRNSETKKEDADRLRAQIPDGARVLYLAFGDTVYYVDHPAQCRYPIATFLQRSRFLDDVADLPSFKENADCVDHDPAPYAVLDRSWFRPGNVDPELQRRITATYDCPPASGRSKTVVCVRR
ncbi:hypothetical protein H1V43_07900 [Streptomyces sp. PSKA54]|uniref:Glycosyltransferase RgtA/B/C/D-like domain-containing protein n=1 Tax=Streptomyces himalayensis subsp. aureolus TaxID=2758039 RepID=A0A7W2CYH3_9ACTN|nr:hypothetical protein [Streptomyces himalayensis]MBA4861311.1 hypothetical protein [Streptomyces himalayensis subsp. aureolus]